jgi:hypothetical protein
MHLLPSHSRATAACVDIALPSSTADTQQPHIHSTFESPLNRLADIINVLQQQARVKVKHSIQAVEYEAISLTLNLATANQDLDTIQTALGLIAPSGGVLMIHNVKPSYPFEALGAVDSAILSARDGGIYYSGYAYQV